MRGGSKRGEFDWLMYGAMREPMSWPVAARRRTSDPRTRRAGPLCAHQRGIHRVRAIGSLGGRRVGEDGRMHLRVEEQAAQPS